MAIPLLDALGQTALRLHRHPTADIKLPASVATTAEFVKANISPNLASIYDPAIRHEYIGCALEHPWSAGCTDAYTGFFIRSVLRSLQLYAPLNVAMTVVFRGKKAFTQPWQTLTRFLKSTLRSSLFLAAYCSMAWIVPCALRKMFNREHILNYFVNGICSGLCVLIEAPGRRLELAMYCLPRALESAWRSLERLGWWRSRAWGELTYFCLAMGVLMGLYQNDPDSIEDNYRGVMTRFFGRN